MLLKCIVPFSFYLTPGPEEKKRSARWGFLTAGFKFSFFHFSSFFTFQRLKTCTECSCF